ncbi:MAG: DNA-binding response regulator [Candidatus Thiodiazotropha sp.]
MLDNNNPIVLVVDDSPDSLGMINTALNQAGFTVLVSLNGQQALDIVAQIKPHVVLMDAMMPVMDGFECCQRMRHSLPLTPIIFMTGLTEVEHIVKAFEHGGTDYISKPIKPEELLARISLHLNNANLINNARIALDEARQYVMAVNPEGRLLWATPETQDLLVRHGIDPKTLDQEMQSQIREWLAQKTGDERVIHTRQKPITLSYFKQISQEEHLVRIVTQERLMDTEKLEAMLPITKREAEVLLWVAHGKTNKEIGEILSLSPRTVNKHLEQIYPKIQVDNRAAATSVAIQTLLGVPFH